MRMLLYFFLLISSVVVQSIVTDEKGISPADYSARKLFNDLWRWRRYTFPEMATSLGLRVNAGELDDLSLEGFEQLYNNCSEFLRIAKEIDEDDMREHVTRVSLQILKYDLQLLLDGYKYNGYMAPINFLNGVHVDFRRTIDQMKKEVEADYHNIISRYNKFPQKAAQIRRLMEEGMRLGHVNNIHSMKKVPGQFALLQVPVEESPFYQLFSSIPEAVQQEAREAVESRLLPAFRELGSFVEDVYMKSLRRDIASSSLPAGVDFYKQCLLFYTSTNLTAEQIHNLGLLEVEKIEGQMKEVIAKLGLNMTIKQFNDKIQGQPGQHYTSREEMIQHYREIVTNKINPIIPKIINPVPDFPVEVKSVRPGKAGGILAYYERGSFDGSRSGVFRINSYTYNVSLRLGALTLSLHETSPGHHLDSAFKYTIPSFPRFRRAPSSTLSWVPFGFPYHTSFGEGWALYAEFLGIEMGLFDEPYELYGYYDSVLFRAIRMVVDTGMHAFGWSRQRAIDYMANHTTFSVDIVETEIDRYITWPGQAVSYKVGEIRLKEMRRRAMDALKDKFDVRRFHYDLLICSGPLDVVEGCVERYIESRSASTGVFVTTPLLFILLCLISLLY